MGTFEDQISRLAAGEVEPGEPVIETPPPGPNAQIEGAAVVSDPPTAEPPLEGAPVDTPAVEDEAVPTAEEEVPAKGVQKRIDQLTRQKHEAKREAEYWREAALKSTPAAPPVSSAPQIYTPPYAQKEPRIEDFANDPDPYTSLARAFGLWAADKKDYENQSRAAQAQQFAQMTAAEQNIRAKMDTGVAKYPDFVEVTDDLGKIVTPAMREALFDSPAFAELAYHLAQNEDEVHRIAKLTPLAQVRELGKLEDKLAVKTANPAAKQVRQPTPVQSAGSGIPISKPNVTKMFEAAKQAAAQGDSRAMMRYLEQTETYQP